MFDEITAALGSDSRHEIQVVGKEQLPSVFDVTGLAVASVGAGAWELKELADVAGDVVVDQALASSWFSFTLLPVDFETPPVWDDLAGDYECVDGFIRLHTNAANHRAAAIAALGGIDTPGLVRDTVKEWRGAELETAVVESGGCAAEMRSTSEWAQHPQGQAVAAEPLIAFDGEPRPWTPTGTGRPLEGLKVLDLTRILAGPVATRFLAGWGADVLRLDPPDWHEPLLEPEVTLGKRLARLDLRTQRAQFDELVGQADVVVHGYRPDALPKLGIGPFEGCVDVSIDAYGWAGPWKLRRGFDSLVQMSCGIADAGMAHYGTDRPKPLPTQALDHGTGYLIAAAVLRALRGGPSRARLSLARTAELLKSTAGDPDAVFGFEGDATEESTPWGEALRLVPPVHIGDTEMRFARTAAPLGSDALSFSV